MAEQAEALTQLSRLLADPALRQADAASLRRHIHASLPLLADGLVAEAAASDDVMDHDSALAYLDRRLAFFGGLIDAVDQASLRAELVRRIESW
jgi:hypothetical protein